jgi:sec-independent protein translocase protein TatA
MRAGKAWRVEDEMGDILQPWHLIVLAVVAFLVFGAKRLPELGKGLGEGLKGFKEGIKGVSDPPPAPPVVQQSAPPPPPAPVPTEQKQS